jgi:hypothetical protein
VVRDYISNRNAGLSAQPGGTSYSPIIDSISYDLDGDGKMEMCTLTHGPTSGLFSFCFYASPMEATAAGATYSGTFAPGGVYHLTLEPAEENLRIRAEDVNDSAKITYYDLVLINGEVVLREVK